MDIGVAVAGVICAGRYAPGEAEVDGPLNFDNPDNPDKVALEFENRMLAICSLFPPQYIYLYTAASK